MTAHIPADGEPESDLSTEQVDYHRDNPTLAIEFTTPKTK